MPRGRKGDDLTGGSGDVNPQTMVMRATQAVADTVLVQGQALPIPRLPIKKGRSLVIELLSVEFAGNSFPPAINGSVVIPFITTDSETPANLLAFLLNPRTLAKWFRVAVVASAAGFQIFENNHRIDMTDEAGHGILVATDNLYMGVVSALTAAAQDYIATLTYRFKDVSLEEYIGIVQSQQ